MDSRVATVRSIFEGFKTQLNNAKGLGVNAVCPACLTPKLVCRRSHLSISPLTPSPLSLRYYSRVLVLCRLTFGGSGT